MKVMKFGGTSVGKPQRMKEVAKLITSTDEPRIVILSALSGTTNALTEISTMLATNDRHTAQEKINALEENACIIDGNRIPIGKSYKDNLMSRLNLF